MPLNRVKLFFLIVLFYKNWPIFPSPLIYFPHRGISGWSTTRNSELIIMTPILPGTWSWGGLRKKFPKKPPFFVPRQNLTRNQNWQKIEKEKLFKNVRSGFVFLNELPVKSQRHRYVRWLSGPSINILLGFIRLCLLYRKRATRHLT